MGGWGYLAASDINPTQVSPSKTGKLLVLLNLWMGPIQVSTLFSLSLHHHHRTPSTHVLTLMKQAAILSAALRRQAASKELRAASGQQPARN